MAHDPFRAAEALRRATDILQEGGQNEEPSFKNKLIALRTLHEPLGGKRKVNHWHPTMEKIIHLHLQLCIDLNMIDLARKGLEQYKKITQQGNIVSLQDVISQFLTKLEKKCSAPSTNTAGDSAAAESDQITLEESLRAGGFSSEEFREMVDRRRQQPQTKFIFRANKFVLDILRVNPKLTILFLNTIQRYGVFCKDYRRKPDLKEIIKMLRKQIERIPHITQKEAEMRKFYYSTPDMYHAYLDTWFKVFEVAISPEMGMWQEAYRIVEQIHFTMYEVFFNMGAKPQHLVQYFEALSKVFWAATVGPHQLYHAYSVLSIWKRKKRLGSADASISNRTVLAFLCIPFTDSGAVDGGVLDRSVENPFQLLSTWTQLLGLRYNPSRETLFSDIKVVIQSCDESVRQLFDVVCKDQYSLNFLHETSDLLNQIAQVSDYSKYVDQIRTGIRTAVVCTAFRSYSYVSTKVLVELCDVPSFASLESIVLQISALRKEDVHIDQENGTLRFVRRDADVFAATLSNVRNVVSSLRSNYTVKRDQSKKDALVKAAIDGLAGERLQYMMRLDLTEKRRSHADVEREDRKKREFQEKMARDAKQRQEAAEALEAERKLREEKKKAEEEKQKELERGRELVQKMETITGKKMDDLKDISDKATLLAAAQARLEKEKKIVEDKAMEEIKRLDFFVRAMREQEAPGMLEVWQNASTQMQRDAEELIQNQKDMHRRNFDLALENKKRMLVMNEKRLAFQHRLIEQRTQAHAQTMKKRNTEQNVVEQLAQGAAKSADLSSKADLRRGKPEEPESPVSPAQEQQAAPAAQGPAKWTAKRGAPKPPPSDDAPVPAPAPPPAATTEQVSSPPAAQQDAPAAPGKWVPKSKVGAKPPPEETAPQAAPPPSSGSPTTQAPTQQSTTTPAPTAGAWRPKGRGAPNPPP